MVTPFSAGSAVLMPFVFTKDLLSNHMPGWEKPPRRRLLQNSSQYCQPVIIERNIDQVNVKDPPFNEVPDNDIRLAAG